MIASSKASSFVCLHCRAGLRHNLARRTVSPSRFLRASRAPARAPFSTCSTRQYSQDGREARRESPVSREDGVHAESTEPVKPVEHDHEPTDSSKAARDDVITDEAFAARFADRMSDDPSQSTSQPAPEPAPEPTTEPNPELDFTRNHNHRHWESKARKVPDPDTFFQRRGQRVYMKPENLEIDILGAPAKAIVMKDLSHLRRRQEGFDPKAVRQEKIKKRGKKQKMTEEEKEQAEAEAALADAAAAGVLNLLDQEGNAISSGEVQENIDELRPVESALLAREFRELGEVLLNGFTSAQLALYLHRNASFKQPEPVNISEEEVVEEHQEEAEDPAGVPSSSLHVGHANSPWLKKQLPWVPAAPDGDDSVDLLLRGYVTNKMTAKERLVIRLMRECWGVSMRELMAGHGQLDVTLGSLEYALLTLGSVRWLEPILKKLKKDELVELVQSTRLLRISATRVTAETVLGEIIAVLKNTITKTFKLADIHPKLKTLKPRLIREVATLTNTHVHLNHEFNEIQVSWINIARNQYHEDAGDQAYRLLVSALQPNAQESASTLTIAGGKSAEDTGVLVEEHWGQDKWAWQHRLRRWFRWTSPISAPNDGEEPTSIPASIPASISPELLQWDVEPTPEDPKRITVPFGSAAAPTATEQGPVEERSKDDWSKDAITSTTAIFGHILHHQPTPQPGQPPHTIRPCAPPSPSTSRILSPIMPPILRSGLSTTLPPDAIKTTILIRLRPAHSRYQQQVPFSSPKEIRVTKSAPPLELRLDATTAVDTHLTSVRAITGTATHDILFPHARADARITQTRYHTLPLSLVDGRSPISVFLRRSVLAVYAGRLTTPARLSGLRLPRRLLTSPPSLKETGSEASEGDDLVPVEYIFAGLEMHRSIATEHDGWRMYYSWVEGGKGGGRRAELSLDANVAPRVEGAEEGTPVPTVTREAFLAVVADVVAGEKVKWVHGNDGFSRKFHGE